MTSKEIGLVVDELAAWVKKGDSEAGRRLPLWEIARQLADLNERQSRAEVGKRQKTRGTKRCQ